MKVIYIHLDLSYIQIYNSFQSCSILNILICLKLMYPYFIFIITIFTIIPFQICITLIQTYMIMVIPLLIINFLLNLRLEMLTPTSKLFIQPRLLTVEDHILNSFLFQLVEF